MPTKSNSSAAHGMRTMKGEGEAKAGSVRGAHWSTVIEKVSTGEASSEQGTERVLKGEGKRILENLTERLSHIDLPLPWVLGRFDFSEPQFSPLRNRESKTHPVRSLRGSRELVMCSQGWRGALPSNHNGAGS